MTLTMLFFRVFSSNKKAIFKENVRIFDQFIKDYYCYTYFLREYR